MALTPIKTPLVVKKMFPNYIWDIQNNDKVIYLTFDDGPTPEITDWTLEVLKQYEAKATFFCIGNNIEKHPNIFQNILKEGHSIGNHTHNHIKGWRSSTEFYVENVAEAERTIKLQEGFQSSNDSGPEIGSLFRPPYGQITPAQGKQLMVLGYKIVMWDVLSFDWDKNISQEACLEKVITNTKKGSVVVFHDSLKASKNMTYSLPKVLKHFSDHGYTFKSIDI